MQAMQESELLISPKNSEKGNEEATNPGTVAQGWFTDAKLRCVELH